MSWIDEKGPLKDVVLSSRIRLARNIDGMPFPTAMDNTQGTNIIDQVNKSMFEGNSVLGRDFRFIAMKSISPLERQILVEKHLASLDLMQRFEISALLLDTKERVSIMVNEEDHIRMQCILPGFQLDKAWEVLNRVDDVIEETTAYAYDEQLGYLTGCPTNVGTGLRASIMVHLPALTMTKHINIILQTISKIGLTARGLYGEGSEALGCMYQISNQITLGLSEEEIIHNLTVAAQQIIAKERQGRKALLQINGIEFEDRVWRALGVLTHARQLDIKEFMALISQVRLGVNLRLIPNLALEQLDAMTVAAQSGILQLEFKQEQTQEDIDRLRADYVRDNLEKALIKEEL